MATPALRFPARYEPGEKVTTSKIFGSMGLQAPLTAALRVEGYPSPRAGDPSHMRRSGECRRGGRCSRDADAIQKLSQGLAGQRHLVWLQHGLMMSQLLAPPVGGAKGSPTVLVDRRRQRRSRRAAFDLPST
jgi:hypothetical protein